MKKIFVDFESFWTHDYSLSKMTTQEYVYDKQFQVMGMGFAVDDDIPRYVPGHINTILAVNALPWHEAEVICHNAQFDGAILEWIYGVKPKRYACTMMMANAFVKPWTGSSSLASCARYYQLPEKNAAALQQTQGLRYEQLTQTQRAAMAEYCKMDVTIMRELHRMLAGKFNEDERDLIHLTITKFTRPRIMLNKSRVQSAIHELDERRTALLSKLGDVEESRATISSNNKFAAALVALGVDPPMKVSMTTGEPTYAFSKTDPDFLALQEHDDPDVQTLVSVRIGAKSTLEKSRLEKFEKIAYLPSKGYLAVPLTYYGAGTGRMSARDGINLQNLTKKSPIRECLCAPPGYKIVVPDLSQIEARVLACLAGQEDLIDDFANGVDVYSAFASDLYGVDVNKDDYPNERNVGKVSILQLGFYAGATGFDRYLRTTAGMPQPFAEVERIVRAYRRRFPRIVALWRWMEHIAAPILVGPFPDAYAEVGGCSYTKGKLTLPNGMPVYYPHARSTMQGTYVYDSTRGKSGKTVEVSMWPGLLTENIVQALARIVLSTAEVALARAGLRAALQVHDELVFVVPTQSVSAVSLALNRALTAQVPWMPALPLACEIKVGDTYKEAK